MRVEHEYERCGAAAYLAAYDVHRAKVFGRCEDTTCCSPPEGAGGLVGPLGQHREHRGQASVRRLEGDWPNLRLIHLPVHASWLDQCEIYFSIVQRKVVNPNDFTDTDQIAERLAAFEQRYNAIAEPFHWTFGRDDLDKLCARLERHAA